MTCKELRESQATRRKHQTQTASKMTVISKARKYRKNRPRRPRSPSISSYHASSCFASQETYANSDKGPGFATARIMMPSDCIGKGHCRIASRYTSQYPCADERIRLSTIPCPSRPVARAGRAWATRKACRLQPRS
jgi:hypothetical protein